MGLCSICLIFNVVTSFSFQFQQGDVGVRVDVDSRGNLQGTADDLHGPQLRMSQEGAGRGHDSGSRVLIEKVLDSVDVI